MKEGEIEEGIVYIWYIYIYIWVYIWEGNSEYELRVYWFQKSVWKFEKKIKRRWGRKSHPPWEMVLNWRERERQRGSQNPKAKGVLSLRLPCSLPPSLPLLSFGKFSQYIYLFIKIKNSKYLLFINKLITFFRVKNLITYKKSNNNSTLL